MVLLEKCRLYRLNVATTVETPYFLIFTYKLSEMCLVRKIVIFNIIIQQFLHRILYNRNLCMPFERCFSEIH